MCSAHAVQLKLESQNILERAFAEYPVSLCGGAVTYVLKKLKRQNTRTIHIYHYHHMGICQQGCTRSLPHARAIIWC